MKKQYDSFNAGTVLLLICMYYIFFFLIVVSADNLANSTENTQFISTNDDYTNILRADGQCQDNRFLYSSSTGQIDKSTKGVLFESSDVANLQCYYSKGVVSETVCNSINGCSWENVTSGFFGFFVTSTNICSGTINASSYGINTTTLIWGNDEVVAHHNNTQGVGVYGSPCNHPTVQYDSELCSLFACEWKTQNQITDEDVKSNTNVFTLVSEVFSFNYDFGFEHELVNTVLTLIFIYLPLLILVLALYYVVHPVK